MKWIKNLALLLLLSLNAQFSSAQMSIQKKNKSYFEVVAGFNYSIPRVSDRYTVLSSIDAENMESLEKEYGKMWQNKGVQFGFRVSYNFTNVLSVLGGFGYETKGFNYRTQYSWADTTSNQSFDREMHHEQKISYFSVPLLVRWDFSEGQFKPYAQAGLVMNFRHQATKVIHYDNTIDEEQTENQVTSSGLVSVTDNTRKFNMGLMAGAGLLYHTKYVTFGVESNFCLNFMPVIEDDNRYSDLNGFAIKYLDVFDQLKLHALNVQFSLSVPITNSVTSNIMRKKRYRRRR